MKINSFYEHGLNRSDISIVIFNRLGIALPLEVRGVVLLGVPSIVRVHHVIAPSHHLCVCNCVDQSAKVSLLIRKHVMSCSFPSHKGALVHAPAAEVNSPSISIVTFARRMAVEMLTLAHVDTSDLVALLLTIPRMNPEAITEARLDVQLFTLIEADSFGVCFHKLKLIALG